MSAPIVTRHFRPMPWGTLRSERDEPIQGTDQSMPTRKKHQHFGRNTSHRFTNLAQTSPKQFTIAHTMGSFTVSPKLLEIDVGVQRCQNLRDKVGVESPLDLGSRPMKSA